MEKRWWDLVEKLIGRVRDLVGFEDFEGVVGNEVYKNWGMFEREIVIVVWSFVYNFVNYELERNESIRGRIIEVWFVFVFIVRERDEDYVFVKIKGRI